MFHDNQRSRISKQLILYISELKFDVAFTDSPIRVITVYIRLCIDWDFHYKIHDGIYWHATFIGIHSKI